ncbi:deoxynucleotidyltransferase terminal-interacting protein 2 [Microtus oregoni]|uniref:deoxynucleotidyltransferase terminal-interacting protein 2 n=1 Tax=Microtus oregoni TaxID=111838 RepID=UPI001BB2BDA4|nr:deoxynucleotidyltransferase terminal-interacting protein 2 [Microtus oregoni]
MVVTRSGRCRTWVPVASGSSQHKGSTPQGIKTHPESKKDDRSIADSETAEKQSSVLSRKRKSRSPGPPGEITEPATDVEVSEAESHASGVTSVFEVEEPIIRITRKRQVVSAPTPKSSVKKRQKITPQHESLDEGVFSEAESHVSGVSMVVPSTERSSRRNKAKSQRDSSPQSQAEAVSDAESSCSGISSSGIAPRTTARSTQRKLQAQAEREGAELIPGNKKQSMGTSVNSEDSDTRQASQLPARTHSQIDRPNFSNNETDDSIPRYSEKKLTPQNHQRLRIQKEKASVASLTEIRKENAKSLDEEDAKIMEDKEITKKDSQLTLSEVQDTSVRQSVSQNHSSTPSNKATPQPSSPQCEALMKSLEHKFAVVKVARLNEGGVGSLKMSDMAQSSDHGDGNDESTSAGDCENKDSQSDVGLESDTRPCKSELSMSQDVDSSVLLFLSSDESQQSENSENEKDSVCSVGNSGQKESSSEDLEDTACGSSLFVIDRTPGLSADKQFYLEDKAPSEVAVEEEEEEEEEGENSEGSSDSDENKDESSDEEDLLNNTKSKLLKLTSSSIDPGLNIKQLGGLYINFNVDKLQPQKQTLTQIKEKKKNELLQKSVITPDFEKNYCVPPYSESKHQIQKQRRKERQKTAGDGWFGMKAPELTDELKNDLKALRMRASMDPKRFYKKNDRDGFPKYFQVGTIADNPADFYHSRIPKKQRKKTIVEELLADSEFRRFNRRKYSEIMAEKAANAAGKKFRKKKKFRN